MKLKFSLQFFLFFFFPSLLIATWADDTLAKLSLEEKVGQLFIAPACPRRGEDHWDDWMRLIKECRIGNVIMKQASPDEQIPFLSHLQQAAPLPLLAAADMEWGLAMRMSDTIAYPRQMTLGAVRDVGKLHKLGREMARQARAVGIHLALGPVADVNSNPLNPIINMRSFGEEVEETAKRVAAMVAGLQEGGVLACVKHFPGHGDTSVDTHVGLPLILHGKDRLQAIEWAPFRAAIECGVAGVMSAHLRVPCLDAAKPASLSGVCLKDVLRNELGFQGLVISDALNMKAIADRYDPGEIACMARDAGCDLLLYGDHLDSAVDILVRETIPHAYQALVEAYRGGLSLEELDRSVLQILRAKERLGLHLDRGSAPDELNSPEALALKRELFEDAVTWVGEPVRLEQRVAYASIGEGSVWEGVFEVPFDHGAFDQVVIAVYDASLLGEWREFLEEVKEKSVICLFASPYALPTLLGHRSILVGYEKALEAQRAVLQVLEGSASARGKLPINLERPLEAASPCTISK